MSSIYFSFTVTFSENSKHSLNSWSHLLLHLLWQLTSIIGLPPKTTITSLLRYVPGYSEQRISTTDLTAHLLSNSWLESYMSSPCNPIFLFWVIILCLVILILLFRFPFIIKKTFGIFFYLQTLGITYCIKLNSLSDLNFINRVFVQSAQVRTMTLNYYLRLLDKTRCQTAPGYMYTVWK